MFDITGEDIAQLNDSDLRILVGRLVEADLMRQKKGLGGVLYGGNQDAPDGGLDVYVKINSSIDCDSFIPRSITGYQVKKPSMPAAKIVSEIRPHGKLRPIIKQLAAEGGAYIIVSSADNVTSSRIQERKNAMKEALGDCIDFDKIYLDFYDRNRLATWVKIYPGVIIWIKNKSGIQISGWRSYDDWSSNPHNENTEFIYDNKPCMYYNLQKSESITTIEGINRIRALLSEDKGCVRLAGLSGVGKTRLLQALFDIKIGENVLNKFDVIYCDIGKSPEPTPIQVAEYYVTQGKKIILAVDNCSPEEHKQLSDICTKSSSKVSLITVEYDVKDDLPKKTNAFYLEPSSSECIEKVLKIHKPNLSNNDVKIISNFSDGNYRIALALSETIEMGESVTGLNDEELFLRLFFQRHEKKELLLDIAAVLSLVYSFNSEYNSEEIEKLALIADISANKLYQAVAELESRRLIQTRGIWKAILPHAISNKLAKRALRTYPKEILMNAFDITRDNRIAISFAHRLSFLHDCKEAVDIVNEYINKAIKSMEIYNQYGNFSLYVNKFAPVSPEKMLATIELLLKTEEGKLILLEPYTVNYIRIIKAIGYDKNYFIRTCKILTLLALEENTKGKEAIDALVSNGNLFLSGTTASIEQKKSVIIELISAENNKVRLLGLNLLDGTLKTSNFTGNYCMEFGARHRNYEYKPTNIERNLHYKTFLDYAVELAITNQEISNEIKEMLSIKVSEFMYSSIFTLFEGAIRKLLSITTWTEGWVPCLHALRFRKNTIEEEVKIKVKQLCEEIKPITLEDEINVYARSPRWGYRDYADFIECEEEVINPSLKVDNYVIELGKKLASEMQLLNNLITSLFLVKYDTRVKYLGRGLAIGVEDATELWIMLLYNYMSIQNKEKKSDLLCGYIQELSIRDNSLSSSIMDDMAMSSELVNEYILIQAHIKNSGDYHSRILKSLDGKFVDLRFFENLANNELYESHEKFVELLDKINKIDNSHRVVLHMLQNKMVSLEQNDTSFSFIAHYTMLYLSEYTYTKQYISDENIMSEISELLEISISQGEDLIYIINICHKLHDVLLECDFWGSNTAKILPHIANKYPIVLLDIFVPDDEVLDNGIIESLNNRHKIYPNTFMEVPIEVLSDWADINPEIRYYKLARLIMVFKNSNNEIIWNDIALVILGKVLDPVRVLNVYYECFFPNEWDGSRANAMIPYLELLKQLFKYPNNIVSEWATKKHLDFEKVIESSRIDEEEMERRNSEKFE